MKPLGHRVSLPGILSMTDFHCAMCNTEVRQPSPNIRRVWNGLGYKKYWQHTICGSWLKPLPAEDVCLGCEECSPVGESPVAYYHRISDEIERKLYGE